MKTVIVLSLLICEVFSLSSQIPDNLKKCYTADYEVQNVRYPPMVPRTLVELLGQLERNRTEPNLRLLVNSIVHVAKFDGVQHASVSAQTSDRYTNIAMPYRGSGYQFIKHDYIVKTLTPDSQAEIQFPQVLTNNSFCLLHFMVSDTIDHRLRGDESKTCPVSYRNQRMELEEGHFVDVPTRLSDCPQLKGVMKTKWGSVSVGPLLAGMASAFKRTTSTNTTVDNVWVSTLGGVLAQAIINQATDKPRLSGAGFWNDTIKPGGFYLRGNYWDVNDALLLGAVDGLILSSEVHRWYNEHPGTRLSQLIASYYSPLGVSFNPAIRACNRSESLARVLNQYDFVKEVTAATVLLNKVGRYLYTLDAGKIPQLAEGAVAQFKTTFESLVGNLSDCKVNDDELMQKRLEVIMIADHTFSQYEMELVLSYLAEQADVSHYSSRVGLMSGSSCRWLVNVTSDIFEMYEAMSKITRDEWPTGLSLSPCLLEVIRHYQIVSGRERTNFEWPYAKVIVVLGQSAYLTDDDVVRSGQFLESIRTTYPESRFVIATDPEHERTFKSLIADEKRDILVRAFKLDDVIVQLARHLREIPSTIIDVYGNSSDVQFEDYITPGMTTRYEIDERYSTLADLEVNIRSRHALTACVETEKSPRQCRALRRGGDEITFRASQHCPTAEDAASAAACSLRFALTTNGSSSTCAEFACRYPDQVLINIRTTWTSASPTRQSTSWSILFAALCLLSAARARFQ